MAIEILKTPTILNKEYTKFQTKDPLLQELIDSFTKVLEQKVEEANLKLFYNNIGTLKIENKRIIRKILSSIFTDTITIGQYYLDDNVVSMLPLNKKDILRKILKMTTKEYIIILYHELLHMSSTIVDKNIFSGFTQINNMGIGIALNDAYTEILLHRLFNIDKKYKSFEYEVIITTLIEEVVTKEKMTNLYFNADLYGLTIELQKYNTKENIIKFLEDLDSVYVLQDYRKGYKKDIIYYHNEISKFVVDTYLNKIKSDLMKGIITKIEYDIKLDKCINDVHTAFEKLELDTKKTRKK